MDKQKINNPEQKAILSKSIGCLIALIFLGISFLICRYFLYIGRMMYEDAPIRGKSLFRIFISLIVCFVILVIKKNHNLDKAIENGTAIRKEVKVIDFVYKDGGENSENGYYIILSDGEKKYESSFYECARTIGKSEKELKSDKFYEKNGITLNLKNRDIAKKQLDQRISDLELQRRELNLFKQVKIDLEIKELKHKKENLEPYHLHTREGDFYIGDNAKVLIDPDDSNNYAVELNNK